MRRGGRRSRTCSTAGSRSGLLLHCRPIHFSMSHSSWVRADRSHFNFFRIGFMLIAPPEIPIGSGRLRRVGNGDIAAFSGMNADPRVMKFFPRPWSREESHAALEWIDTEFTRRGFGIYAVESEKEFAGIVGLSVPAFEAYFTPCVEILWRLVPRFWGRGLASESGSAVLRMAFQTLNLPEVVAFAVAENARSIRVMERLGMERDQRAYFDHPAVTDTRLQRHVLFRASAKLSG
jgi:RimJ/RimL family protein N-acetyltransferase